MSRSAGLLACGCLLGACDSAGGGPDWRPHQIDLAEQKIRAVVGDSSATFFEVQLTGDQATGQTCGKVKPLGHEAARFIVYIDNTAGPFIEGGLSKQFLTPDRFASAWLNDCLNEGYKTPKAPA